MYTMHSPQTLHPIVSVEHTDQLSTVICNLYSHVQQKSRGNCSYLGVDDDGQRYEWPPPHDYQ